MLKELKIGPDYRMLGEARELIHSTGAELGFDEAAIWDMKVAATEALANAIEYGTASDGLIQLRLTAADGALSLEISGGPPGSRSSRAPDPHRGRGMAIMSSLMDEVSVLRQGSDTSVRLSKRLTSAPSGDGSD